MDKETLHLHVKGMVCTGCEASIERALGQLQGVSDVKADHNAGTVQIGYSTSEIIPSAIANAITTAGYEVEENSVPASLIASSSGAHSQASSWDARIRNTLVFLALILVIGGIVQWGRSMMPGVMMQLTTGLSYTTLFMIGVLTGFHCIGMCGSFVVSYSRESSSLSEAALSHAAYGSGKTLSYASFGALFGLGGALLTITPIMRGWAAAAAGLFLLLFGLKMLHIIPPLTFLSMRFPKAMTNRVMGEIDKSHKPFITGLLNGLLLGCGPLQAMYILAAGTGSPIEGALMLTSFGLGTLPALLGFGFFASYLSQKSIAQLVQVSAVLVIMMGFMMLNRGYSLLTTLPAMM